MKIVFVHQADKSFCGDSLQHSPLGGTETALIGVTRSLAQNPDNEVIVFTKVEQTATYDGVTYHPLSFLGKWSQTNETDVFITIRQWLPLVLPVRAKLHVYFSPDAYNQPAVQRAFDIGINIENEDLKLPLFPALFFMDNADAVFCVGRWQAKTFVDILKFPEDKIFITANGVFLENFSPQPLAQRQPGIVYSSTPFRGLNHLITMIPKIQQSFPELSVEVCSGMGVYGASREEDENTYGRLYQDLLALKAHSHGSILQKELARILCHNRVYTYPNTFEETFCISVLEAQAAGLPVVTSRRGALVERVTDGVDGFLISGNPGENAYDTEFIKVTQELLTNDNLWQKMSDAAQKKAQTFTYDHLASQWQSYFDNHLTGKLHHLPRCQDIFKIPVLAIPHPTKPDLKINLNRQDLNQILQQALQPYGFQIHFPT